MIDFYTRYETQIKALLALPVLCFFIYFISKEPKFSCDEYAKGFRDGYECHLILSSKADNNAGIVSLYGKDLFTHRDTVVEDGSKWIAHRLNIFNLGDTIIKNKGEYGISIRRKNRIIRIPFECDKVYLDAPKTH